MKNKKTISFDRAQFIAKDLRGSDIFALYSFANTGRIDHFKASEYHQELDNLLSTPYKFTRNQYKDIQMLKRYFEVHKPI